MPKMMLLISCEVLTPN